MSDLVFTSYSVWFSNKSQQAMCNYNYYTQTHHHMSLRFRSQMMHVLHYNEQLI